MYFIIPISIVLLLYLYAVCTFRTSTLDDAFITFRYADNVSQCSGLRWNRGDLMPTEGMTAMSWVFILAAFHSIFKIDFVILSKVIGTLAVLFSAWVITRHIYNHILTTMTSKHALGVSFLAAGTFLMNGELAYHSISGMETALALCLVSLFCTLLASLYNTPTKRQAMVTALAAVVCGLTRPEMNAAIFLSMLTNIAVAHNRRLNVCYCLAPYLISGFVYFTWRWLYFGLPFPLPFYIKQFAVNSFLPGFGPTLSFFRSHWPLWPAMIIAVAGLKRLKNWWPNIVFLGTITFYFLFPCHIMGGYHRYLSPLLPLMILLLFIGCSQVLGTMKRFQNLLVTILVSCTVVSVSRQIFRFNAMNRQIQTDARFFEQGHVTLGKALRSIDSTGKRLCAVSDAGAIPFYSNYRVIDSYGLNDRDIALARMKGRNHASMVLEKCPDLIVLISNFNQSFQPVIYYEAEIYKEALKDNYSELGCVWGNPEYSLFLLAKTRSFADSVVQGLLSAYHSSGTIFLDSTFRNRTNNIIMELH